MPLAKTKNINSMADTRPISNLSEISKIFERLVFTQLSEYLNENNLMDPYQTGFRRGHSTQTALIKLCDDVRASVENRKVTILVMFDFSKAFDMVPHKLLLRKLRLLGCSDNALN